MCYRLFVDALRSFKTSVVVCLCRVESRNVEMNPSYKVKNKKELDGAVTHSQRNFYRNLFRTFHVNLQIHRTNEVRRQNNNFGPQVVIITSVQSSHVLLRLADDCLKRARYDDIAGGTKVESGLPCTLLFDLHMSRKLLMDSINRILWGGGK